MNKKECLCIICGKNAFINYGELLIKCQDCGLVVAKQIPDYDDLVKLYKKEYFFGKEYSDYIADRPALEKNFRKRIKSLQPYINKNSRVIEIGCAYGYFLNLIKDEVAWHKGFDVSKEGVEYARNKLHVNAHTENFLYDKEIKPETLDLVCMWDVVEHLGEPDKHVKKAAGLLKKGGALSLTTGDISSVIARLRGLSWRMIHPPTHIYYFSPESIKKLLAQYSLSVTDISYRSSYRNTGSIYNQIICNRKAKSKNTYFLNLSYKVSRLTKLDKLNIPLNLFDLMEVTAVKNE